MEFMSIRTYKKGPRVYLDLDGVIADFEQESSRLGLHPQQAKLIPGVYTNLRPMEGAIEGVNCLLDLADRLNIEVFLLTKIPSKNPYAASEKLIWVNKHLPRIKDYVIISPDKGCVGTSIDILVDDHPEWANADSFVGTIIHYGERVRNWDELVQTISSMLQTRYIDRIH
jgi:hypothetical protein